MCRFQRQYQDRRPGTASAECPLQWETPAPWGPRRLPILSDRSQPPTRRWQRTSRRNWSLLLRASSRGTPGATQRPGSSATAPQSSDGGRRLELTRRVGELGRRWSFGNSMGCRFQSDQMLVISSPQCVGEWTAPGAHRGATVPLTIFNPRARHCEELVSPLAAEMGVAGLFVGLDDQGNWWPAVIQSPTPDDPASFLVQLSTLQYGTVQQKIHGTNLRRVGSSASDHVQRSRAVPADPSHCPGAGLTRERSGALQRLLGDALRDAALARVRRIRVESADGGLTGSYLRSFILHKNRPQWTLQRGGKLLVIRFKTTGYELVDRTGRVIAGGEDGSPLPLDQTPAGGQRACRTVWKTSDGRRLQLSIEPGCGRAEDLPMFSNCAEQFRLIGELPSLFKGVSADSELARARAEAQQRRITLADAQDEACKGQPGARERRDAARLAALEAQKALVQVLHSRLFNSFFPNDGANQVSHAGAKASLMEQLGVLQKSLLATDYAGTAAPSGGELDGDSPIRGIIRQAEKSAEELLRSCRIWQQSYADAVERAERATDAAVAAAQAYTLGPSCCDGSKSLDDLAMAITEAAEAEAALRASPEGVTSPPLDMAGGAVHHALVAADAALGELCALGTERCEAKNALDDLADGCKAAEKGRFYARLTAFAESPADSVFTPRPSQEVGADSLAALDYWADRLRTRLDHAPTPAKRAELDSVILKLRQMRKKRAAEAVYLLRLARSQFPECIDLLRQGAHNDLRSWILEGHPQTLQLLAPSGRLADYTPRPGACLRRRPDLLRADGPCAPGAPHGQSGRVVIKTISLINDDAREPKRDVLNAYSEALQRLGRCVMMMDTAGEAAAAVHRVFVDMHTQDSRGLPAVLGCIVMKDYPFTLMDWVAPERAKALSPATILRMVQQLLDCLVRLHSAAPRLRHAEPAVRIIHGDINPDGIVMDQRGQPSFIDFEMARTGGMQSAKAASQGCSLDFVAPELLGSPGATGQRTRDPAHQATKMTDVFAMGATLRHILTLHHIRPIAGNFADFLLPLCDRMMHGAPSKRPTAAEAWADSFVTDELDIEMNRAQDAIKELDRAVAAERDRVQRERLSVQAEERRVAEKEKMLAAQAASLKRKGDAESEEHRRKREEIEALYREVVAERDRVRNEHEAMQAERERVAQEARDLAEESATFKDRSAAEKEAIRRQQDRLQAEEKAVHDKLGELAAALQDREDAVTAQRRKMEARMGEVEAKDAEVEAKRGELEAKRALVEAEAQRLERLRQAVYDPPKHWTHTDIGPRGWQAVPVAGRVFDVFRASLLATKAAELGVGPDACNGPCSRLELQRVWRIENPNLWRRYFVERKAVADALTAGRLNRQKLSLRRQTEETLGPKGTLPDPLHSDGGLNEVRLFHGTNTNALRSLLGEGLSQAFSGTATSAHFGQGLYFAEDPGKCDQYCSPHTPGSELDGLLYPPGDSISGPVHHVLVCRVVCGDYAVTMDGKKQHTTGGPLFATQTKRELVPSSAGDRYTSLVVETGARLKRYREFVLFHGQRAYPEYLLAYTRV
eukprot:TRINITY_DN27748_c0_g1_i3.p1 TRINITY_DN27748_c0_g1~~TRINITY_DN27748_c0_g1_i3.p1  ORF type:complete len:1549 (+),score=171.40 TRINITY_DN27748_c0_g1_i3:736-5382(+)